MTTTRSLLLAVAAVLALAGSGCGDKSCGDATPPVSAVPASCSAQAGAQVTVPMHVCPRCDQATPTCLVHAENAAAGQITLEPVSEVCDPNSSCPLVDPGSCPFATLNCQFTAPATAGSVNVTIVTPGTPESFTLAVGAASSAPPPVICAL